MTLEACKDCRDYQFTIVGMESLTSSCIYVIADKRQLNIKHHEKQLSCKELQESNSENCKEVAHKTQLLQHNSIISDISMKRLQKCMVRKLRQGKTFSCPNGEHGILQENTVQNHHF